MAISFINTTTDHGSSVTSRTPAEPSGASENDLIIAFVTLKTSGAAPDGVFTDPTEFTQIDQFNENQGDQWRIYAGYKLWSSSDTGGYTWSYDGTAGIMRASLAMFRGVDSGTPFDVSYVKANHYVAYNADGGLSAAQDITTATDNAWVTLFQYFTDADTYTVGVPSGYTEFMDHQGVFNRSHVGAYKSISTAATENPGVWSHATPPSNADSSNFTFALRPSSGTNETVYPFTGPWR